MPNGYIDAIPLSVLPNAIVECDPQHRFVFLTEQFYELVDVGSHQEPVPGVPALIEPKLIKRQDDSPEYDSEDDDRADRHP